MSVNLLVRADGGPGIGSGHLMRCLALAQAAVDGGGTCALATATPEAEPAACWRDEGLAVVPLEAAPGEPGDAQATAEAASQARAKWVVLDGYALGSSFQRALKQSGHRLLILDDVGATLEADVVVNPTLGAETRCRYDAPEGCTLLLGSAYALIRRQLRRVAGRDDQGRSGPRLLVTLGGDDPEGHALAALRALCAAGTRLGATVVVTQPASLAEARALAAAAAAPVIVSPPVDLASLVGGVDVALCAAGTTALELASVGVAMVVVPLAANQRPGAQALAAAGAALLARPDDMPGAVGLALDLAADPRRRAEMAALGRRLVDGQGATRVLAHLRGRDADTALRGGEASTSP